MWMMSSLIIKEDGEVVMSAGLERSKRMFLSFSAAESGGS